MELQDLPRDLWLPFPRKEAEAVVKPERTAAAVQPVEKPGLRKAVSVAQIEWARRQLQCLDAGGKVDQLREALVVLAATDPTGLPERAANKKAATPARVSGRRSRDRNPCQSRPRSRSIALWERDRR
jgi:hypothetical protein